MLATGICWVIIFVVFYSFGDIFISFYKRLIRTEEQYSFLDTFFIGLCVTGIITGITSLWVASGTKLLICFTALSLLYILFVKRQEIVMKVKDTCNNLSLFQIILVLACLFLFLVYMTMPPQLPDTFYYHIQNVMWNEEFSVVPGLANLQERFGFNSNSLLLASVFGLRPLFGQFIFGVNSLCMLLLLIQIIFDLKRKPVSITLISLFAYTIFFLFYIKHIPSLSTDLLPNLFIMYLLFSLLADKENIKRKTVLFWLIPIFCITLKLSILFIALLSLYVLIYFVKEKSYKAIAFICLTSLLVIVPWLVRNVIISGYLIYPYPSLDLFNVDWKLPLEYVIESQKYIKAYAISYEAMYVSSDYVLNLPWQIKFQKWFSELFVIELFVISLACVSPLFMLFAYKKSKSMKESPVLIGLWLIALVGVIFWAYMAPGVRFGVGFLLTLFFIPTYFILKEYQNMFRPVFLNTILVITILCLATFIARYFYSIKSSSVTYTQLLYKPQGLRTVTEKDPLRTEVVRINNVLIIKPLNWGCLDSELPCSGDFVKNIEMRGESFQDGFREKKWD